MGERIDEIVKTNQPDTFGKLKKKKKRRRKKKKFNEVSLTFDDFERMMRHDSYERHNGAMRQR